MMYRMSKHASKDRFERMAFLATEIGIGEELCKSVGRTGYRHILTTTGIVLILPPDEDIVVTAYLATMAEVTFIWRNSGMPFDRMPNWFYTRVRDNRKLYTQMHKNDLYGKNEKYHEFF